VAVTVPVDVFVGAARECGRPLPAGVRDWVEAHPGAVIGAGVATSAGAPVSDETARRLACDAELRRLVVDPAGLVLDVGRAIRTVSPQLRLAVEHRDGGRCRFPGCRSRIDEAHHLTYWSNGGRTVRSNLIGLCWFHHHEVHHRGWVLTGSADDEVVFRRRDRGTWPARVSAPPGLATPTRRRPAEARPTWPDAPPPGPTP
jgi:hypothetical protein